MQEGRAASINEKCVEAGSYNKYNGQEKWNFKKWEENLKETFKILYMRIAFSLLIFKWMFWRYRELTARTN